MKARIFVLTTALIGAAGSVSGRANAQSCSTPATTSLAYDSTACNNAAVIYAKNEAGGTAPYGVYGEETSSAGAAAGVFGKGNTGVAGVGVGAGVYGHCTGGGTCSAGYFEGNATVTGSMTVSGSMTVTGSITVGSCTGCSSDRRLKENVQPLHGAMQQLLQLNPVTFDWKNPEEHEDQPGRQTGFIAQDVEKVFPQWVGEDKKGFKTLVIPEKQMAALMVDSIRALKAENDDLRNRVKVLESNRRPMISGMGENALGFGLAAMAGAIVVTRRKRSAASASL